MIESYSEHNHKRSLHPTFTGISIRNCIIALAFLFLSTTRARADTTYCYQGNDFTDVILGFAAGDAVNGCVTLISALPTDSPLTLYNSDVVSFSFSVVVETIGGSTSTPFDTFAFQTEGGVITEWQVYVAASQGVAVISTIGHDPDFSPPSQDSAFGIGGPAQAHNYNEPGVWSVAEPSSLSLLLLGLILVGILSQRAILAALKAFVHSGSLATVEGFEPVYSLSSSMLKRQYGEMASCSLGDISVILPELIKSLGKLDFFFHDASNSREDYIDDFSKIVDSLAPGAVVLFDDIHREDARQRANPRTYEG